MQEFGWGFHWVVDCTQDTGTNSGHLSKMTIHLHICDEIQFNLRELLTLLLACNLPWISLRRDD